MVDQVRKGNRQNNSFGKKAWKYMYDDFFKKTGLKWDKERQYVIVKSLLDQSDFNWGENTGIITAKDEAWDNYIKEHPDAESMRSIGCLIYKQLCTIFSESGANGTNEQSAEHKEGIPYEYPCPEPLSMHREESSSYSRKRGRRGIDNVIAGAILEMAVASKLRTVAIRQ
ncbi:hypothetical protein PVL29_026135 [Vitis rotundifolia]|uniref:Myb/SANT-like domain-containing protein n=1 Tax=Vitis rotundifolia TaxID=103349 RepID=A0AA38YLQ3_VITRO|nr:hypothetical protein PVL29_026135 [Vitis rotundifolia]